MWCLEALPRLEAVSRRNFHCLGLVSVSTPDVLALSSVSTNLPSSCYRLEAPIPEKQILLPQLRPTAFIKVTLILIGSVSVLVSLANGHCFFCAMHHYYVNESGPTFITLAQSRTRCQVSACRRTCARSSLTVDFGDVSLDGFHASLGYIRKWVACHWCVMIRPIEHRVCRWG